jgi:hypothetical protein
MAQKLHQSAMVLIATLMFYGCGSESTGEPDDEAGVIQQASSSPAVSVEKATAKNATPKGKPGADVSLVDNSVRHLEPGVDAEVVLELAMPYTDGELSVTVTTSEGLLIVAGATNYTFNLGQHQTYSIPLRLIAPNPGRYYVNLQVQVYRDGRQTFRAVSAIVQVGEGTEPVRADAKQQKPGNPDDVIPLPAREEIIQQPAAEEIN